MHTKAAIASTLCLLLGQTVAQNSCTSRLISCFAFPVGNNQFDYELIWDQLPNGSMSSICNNLAKAFPKAGLGNPGCQKLDAHNSAFNVQASNNVVTLSTRISGSDTQSGFDSISKTFEGVLQCNNNVDLATCTAFPSSIGQKRHHISEQKHAARAATVPNMPVWMATPGNSLITEVGTLTLLSLAQAGVQQSIFPFFDNNAPALAGAANQIANSIALAAASGFSTIYPFEAPIANTGLNLVVSMDWGLGRLTSQAIAGSTAGSWVSIFEGLIARASVSQTDVIAGVYSTAATGIDLMISMTIGSSQT